MKWDDDSLEEINVLLSQWDSKTADNASQNIEKLSSSVELVVLMDESIETVGDRLSNHLSSWDELTIHLRKVPSCYLLPLRRVYEEYF